MERLFDVLSTREVALLSWILFGICAMMFKKDLRNGLGQIIKILFSKQIGTILVMLTLYVCLLLTILYKVKLWDISLFKDTIFWYCTSAIVLLFSVNKAKDNAFFKIIVSENLKWAIILEFIINFYTFSLMAELIIIPVITFLLLLQAFASRDEKNIQVSKLLEYITGSIGLILFAYAIYITFIHYEIVFTIHNLFSFMLPPILTILLIPFLYVLAVYMNYELLFIRIDFLTNDDEKRNKLKRAIIFAANLNLNYIKAIDSKLNKFDLYHEDNFTLLYESIKKGSR